jgi:DNA-binding response OmpR family regulator
MSGKILIIDDHPHVQDILANFLRAAGHRITLCSDGATALAHLAREPHTLIVVDLGLPDLPGLDLVRQAKAMIPQTPLVVITGSGDLIDPKTFAERGIDYWLAKPFTRDQFMAVVASALGQPV